MDVSVAKRGLAAAVDAAMAVSHPDVGLVCFAYVPDSVPEPCFYAGEVVLTRNLTFARPVDVRVTCKLLVSRSDDQACQALLDRLLVPVWDAIEGTPGVAQTLGGACDDVVVERIQGYRLYTVGEARYYGAEYIVRVIE